MNEYCRQGKSIHWTNVVIQRVERYKKTTYGISKHTFELIQFYYIQSGARIIFKLEMQQKTQCHVNVNCTEKLALKPIHNPAISDNKLTRVSFTQNLNGCRHFLFTDAFVFLSLCGCLQSLPGEGAQVKIHEYIAQGLQVISARLFYKSIRVEPLGSIIWWSGIKMFNITMNAVKLYIAKTLLNIAKNSREKKCLLMEMKRFKRLVQTSGKKQVHPFTPTRVPKFQLGFLTSHCLQLLLVPPSPKTSGHAKGVGGRS